MVDGPVTVIDVERLSRFEAHAEDALVGYAEYVRGNELVEYTHTVVSPEHQGQGVGGTLARTALDDARRRGLTARPSCPYIAEWISRHPDYRDLVE